MLLKFKMLTVKQVVSQIRSKDWLVTIDLKDAYFHISILPQHRKFLRFAFRGEACQYRVLPFGLALSPCTFAKCVDAALTPLRLQGIRILNYIDDWLILAQSEQMAVQHRSHERAGVETERQEECGVGFDYDAGTFVTCSNRVDPHCSHESERRPVTHCEAVSTTVGSDGSCVIPFGLLYMRPLQWWLRTKGFSPRGSLFCMIKVTWRCLPALDMWKKSWFLSQGPVLGVPCRRITLATDVSLTGWGVVTSGHPTHDLRDCHVLVHTDSTAVDKLLSLRAVHIPGHLKCKNVMHFGTNVEDPYLQLKLFKILARCNPLFMAVERLLRIIKEKPSESSAQT
ncbi:Transposon Ty3-G Gag-Pol polyprotein [Labeo rohita]|uniref:ribonuclease H n=1 Tax=Labeo rohita TaxID=84645 RepID=A0ABQ8LYA7_LABRO|nr:Transposon Ty3-G Gag-Pol polyprotein [Labeo rohita]